MKHVFLVVTIIGLMLACNDEATTTDASATDLPYTAVYSGSWDANVSDADLKTVLQTYKDWAGGNLDGVMSAMGDSVSVDEAGGVSATYSNADLRKRWASSLDSLSSVEIQMDAWHKMRSEKQKDSIVVVWYKQIETYKNGRVDSALYHDINMLKGGKIVWYSQYKRPLLKK